MRLTERNLKIVITMGGLGSRFRKAGYDLPKYMIRARGRTLFEWSMESLEGFRKAATGYVFIALQDKTYDVKNFIRDHCDTLKLKPYHIILLDHLTEGQAATAMLAGQYCSKSDELLIYNIDTYVEAYAMNADQLKGDGFIPCFYAKGDHWSFVRLDQDGKVAEVKEKDRISDHCSIGAYYFRSFELYRKLYEDYYINALHPSESERYIAPLYDHLIKKGGTVYITDFDAKKVHVLGTPEELDLFLKEKEESLKCLKR